MDEELHGDETYVAEQERAAAEEAAEVGGGPVSDDTDEAERPLAEAGQGESEGFEQAEEQLVENATHEAEYPPDPTHLAGQPEEAMPGEYGEADTEESEDA